MIKTFSRLSLLALVFAVPASDLAAAPRVAKMTAGPASYDGTWNLNIMTDRGSCDRSYNFQVQINSGYVMYTGPARSSGRVAPSGAVSVSVVSGQRSARGTGRLAGRSGSGRWAGTSSTGAACSGRWTASKF